MTDISDWLRLMSGLGPLSQLGLQVVGQHGEESGESQRLGPAGETQHKQLRPTFAQECHLDFKSGSNLMKINAFF